VLFGAALVIGPTSLFYYINSRQPVHTDPLKPAPSSDSTIFDPSLLGGITTGFHSPDLGMQMMFVGQDQAALIGQAAGALVMEVESSRPAAKAGVHAGDVIISIAGRKIATEDDLRQALRKFGPADTSVTVRRGQQTKTMIVKCADCKDTS
jgi:serine protease Do